LNQKLEQSPIASLPQLIQTDASINMVQSGGYGQAASIFLRGGNSNQTCFKRWCPSKFKYFWQHHYHLLIQLILTD
jgi:hypothetical protein